LEGADGTPITIGDLWALVPGTGNAGTDPNKIYFTAGVLNEAQGLFGSLAANPEPNNSAMSTTGSHSMTGSMTGSISDSMTNPVAGSMTGPVTGSHSMHG
jgi:hypothetical protein